MERQGAAMGKNYALIFTGKLAKGSSEEEARRTLTGKYGMSERQLAQLFRGKPTVIKRWLNRKTALALKAKFGEVGMLCEVGPVNSQDMPSQESEAAPPQPEDKAAPPPAQAVRAESSPGETPGPVLEEPHIPRPQLSKMNSAKVTIMLLWRYGADKGAYPERKAPEKKFKNAMNSCFLDDDEVIYGVLDTSVSGECEECVVFASDGINYSTSATDKGFIPYREFLELELTLSGVNGVALGDEHLLFMGEDTPMTPGQGLAFFQELQQGLARGRLDSGKPAKGTPPKSPPPDAEDIPVIEAESVETEK